MPVPRFRILSWLTCITGIWAINFADEHPSAEVIGTDLSPIQPHWVPPNLRFEIDDAESEWAYESKFEFIHLRTMGGSLKDIPKLLRQAYDNLKPGGWIEWQEYETDVKSDDDSFPENSYILKYYRILNEAASKFGKKLNIAPILKPSIEEAGFINVVDKVYKVRLSSANSRHWRHNCGVTIVLASCLLRALLALC